MYLPIIKVKVFDDFILLVEFKNNEKRLFDIKPYLNIGRFKELKDKNKFKDVRVSFDTIEWGCGLDLDSEFIYEKSIKYNN